MLVFIYENWLTDMEDVEKGVIVEYVDKCTVLCGLLLTG